MTTLTKTPEKQTPNTSSVATSPTTKSALPDSIKNLNTDQFNELLRARDLSYLYKQLETLSIDDLIDCLEKQGLSTGSKDAFKRIIIWSVAEKLADRRHQLREQKRCIKAEDFNHYFRKISGKFIEVENLHQTSPEKAMQLAQYLIKKLIELRQFNHLPGDGVAYVNSRLVSQLEHRMMRWVWSNQEGVKKNETLSTTQSLLMAVANQQRSVTKGTN
jgi:hypothetical protein